MPSKHDFLDTFKLPWDPGPSEYDCSLDFSVFVHA